MQELILTVGLPGSGKSTYINGKYIKCGGAEKNINDDSTLRYKYDYIHDNHETYSLISADIIKTVIKGYLPCCPERVHEKSVDIAEKAVYDQLKINNNVFMDGGGINNNYTARIIATARLINPKIHIKAIYFNTPVEVCIKRISSRERKVPIDNIYEKNQKIPRCINKLKEICDEFETVNYFTNKYVFLDMDGTICSYSTVCKDIDGNIDFVNGELFKYLTPVKFIIDNIHNNFNNEQLFILTACPNSIAWVEKQEWINKHLPFIKKENIYFVGNKDYKHVFLKHLMLKLKIMPNDICMIDDNFSILEKMQTIGVNAIHPSNIESIIN